MSKYVIEDTTLTAIADAVRTKAGTTEPIVVSELPDAIAAIPQEGGGGGTTGTRKAGLEYVYVGGSSSAATTTLPASKVNDIFAVAVSTSSSKSYISFKGQEDLSIQDSHSNGLYISSSGSMSSSSLYYATYRIVNDVIIVSMKNDTNTVVGNLFTVRVYYWKDEGEE